jgi:putative spermidine/putrescine transport system permease protein
MWMGLRDNIDPAIAALSVILILITVTVLVIRSIVQSRRRAT